MFKFQMNFNLLRFFTVLLFIGLINSSPILLVNEYGQPIDLIERIDEPISSPVRNVRSAAPIFDLFGDSIKSHHHHHHHGHYPHHGGGGYDNYGGGGSQAYAGSAAYAGSGSGGYGGYGHNPYSHSEAQSGALSFSAGPFSASVASSQANSASGGGYHHHGGYGHYRRR